MIPARIVERKRDGETLSSEELGAFLDGYLAGDVTDYQMAAFLMAVYFRGMSGEETACLLETMLRSGVSLDLSDLGAPIVDKHSTGGVGDKVSLALAPLAASLGLVVPMMAGRGLGHTGGTLDKLEAIPGLRTALDLDELRGTLAAAGCAIVAPTDRIAPLDRRLYALRDVTGTVASVPLIAASIMSKKLAEGLDGLVLDVKAGSGAFLPREEDALVLARAMVDLGVRRGTRVTALVTAMDRPLGWAVGNGLETAEAIACLRGGGPADLRELVVRQAEEMVALGRPGSSLGSARASVESALDSGRALERFRRMVEAQSGDPAAVDAPERLVSAPERRVVEAEREGVVTSIEPRGLGWGVVSIGGGRRRLGDALDPRVGFEIRVHPGDRIAPGRELGTVHARDPEGAAIGEAALREAVRVDRPEDPAPRALVTHRVTPDGVERPRV